MSAEVVRKYASGDEVFVLVRDLQRHVRGFAVAKLRVAEDLGGLSLVLIVDGRTVARGRKRVFPSLEDVREHARSIIAKERARILKRIAKLDAIRVDAEPVEERSGLAP